MIAALPRRPAETTLPSLGARAKIASRAGKPGSGFMRDRNKLVCWHPHQDGFSFLERKREKGRKADRQLIMCSSPRMPITLMRRKKTRQL